MPQEQTTVKPLVGKVTRIFSRLGCVGIKVDGPGFKAGDTLLFESRNTLPRDHQQVITSIEINHAPVATVTAGQRCAVKLSCDDEDTPTCGSLVFLVPVESDQPAHSC